MQNEIFGRIYKITNKINGKIYIGQTKLTLKERFNIHVSKSKNVNSNGYKTMPIVNAIHKYGSENFIIDEICVTYSQTELNLLEGKYINLYNALNKEVGYNIQQVDLNGNYKHSEETKQKCKETGKKNRGKSEINATSKYVGVCKVNKYWTSFVFVNGKLKYLGTYNTEIEAAQARDISELEYIGEQAILNFPELRDNYLNGEIKPQKRIQYQNVQSNKKSNSQIVGVSFDKYGKRWIVQLKGFKRTYFKTKEEAETYATQCHKIRKSQP